MFYFQVVGVNIKLTATVCKQAMLVSVLYFPPYISKGERKCIFLMFVMMKHCVIPQIIVHTS